jgi:hypothetical protein
VTSEQLTLPTARHTDPPTSKAAAESIPPGVLEGAIIKVFVKRFSTAAHGQEWGLTDDQLCEILDYRHGPTVKSARSRLTKAGRLVNSGRTAPSNRGKPSIIWRLP